VKVNEKDTAYCAMREILGFCDSCCLCVDWQM